MTATGFCGNPDDEVHDLRLREAGATLIIHDMRKLREMVTAIRDAAVSRRETRQTALSVQRF